MTVRDTAAHLPLVNETLDATQRYLGALGALDEQSARRPSVLPGWSRAHVVAHVSRNADALTRVLAQASAGGPASMYDSREAREHDIEDTVRRLDVPDLVADARRSAGRLERALLEYDGPADATYARTPDASSSLPVSGVGALRRAEVEIHHADLDVGYGPADWPTDFSLAMVKRRQDELAAEQGGGPSMVLSSTDVPGLWKLGEGQGPQVHGTAGDLAWWLVGRGGGQGLTSSVGELPALGRWR